MVSVVLPSLSRSVVSVGSFVLSPASISTLPKAGNNPSSAVAQIPSIPIEFALLTNGSAVNVVKPVPV